MERASEYYRRRIADEMLAAEAARSAVAEQRHRQLAMLYSCKLQSLGGRTGKPSPIARKAPSRAGRIV